VSFGVTKKVGCSLAIPVAHLLEENQGEMAVKKKTKKKPAKKTAKKLGQPTKLTKELQEELCKHLRSGCYQNIACDLVGISEETFRNWRKWGRNGDPRYKDFFEAIKKASAHPFDVALSAIFGAIDKGDWKAAAWFLERRRPKEWALRSGDEMSEEEVRPLMVEIVEKK
jgi:hypothetical protein